MIDTTIAYIKQEFPLINIEKNSIFFIFLLNVTYITYMNKNLHVNNNDKKFISLLLIKFILLLIKNFIQKLVEILYRNYNKVLFFNNMLYIYILCNTSIN